MSAVLASARTFTLDGISARPVRVEVDVHRGLPNFSIVGLPDAAVREARERVRAGLVNCGFEFPLRRIVANLAPASLRKAGPGMDLAIAAALLTASGQLSWEGLPRLAMIGELALDGSIRPVSGALAIAEAAREGGARGDRAYPPRTVPRRRSRVGWRWCPLTSLAGYPRSPTGSGRRRVPSRCGCALGPAGGTPDLADLRGQPHLRYALGVAAAGGHSLLMVGPPGAGKSLAARSASPRLPRWPTAEALEVARIVVRRGRLDAGPRGRAPLPLAPPHDQPRRAGRRRHSSGPGEAPWRIAESSSSMSCASSGATSSRDCGRVERRRGGDRAGRGGRRLPCRFMLVAAANPCRAGGATPIPTAAAGGRGPALPGAVERGAGRPDRPARGVRQPRGRGDRGRSSGEASAAVRDRVASRRASRQDARLGPGRSNAEMTPGEVRDCALDRRRGLASRRSLLAAPTQRSRPRPGVAPGADVADLDGAARHRRGEMAQALQLRRRDYE